jgi:hypothetical protein
VQEFIFLNHGDLFERDPPDFRNSTESSFIDFNFKMYRKYQRD